MRSESLYTLLFFGVNFFDILTTLIGLLMGGQEQNPLMFFVLERGPYLFVIVKILAAISIGILINYVSEYTRRLPPEYKYKRKVRALYHAGSFLPSVTLAVTVFNNFFWILANI